MSKGKQKNVNNDSILFAFFAKGMNQFQETSVRNSS